ncbi:MAG: DUF2797 domain-containing protein [Woeseiaceae bacterium]
MKKTGHLQKMLTSLGKNSSDPIQYQLPLDDEKIPLNHYIGKTIKFKYLDEIHCLECGRKTNKNYNQGFCFPCFKSLAKCDMCIMKPETCHFHEGTCREPEWGKEFCFNEHYVYLANSSGIKVGITRGTQLPTRWIDQGASEAMPIFKVSNRLLSGKIEMAIKEYVSDRTDWRKMLKGSPDSVDLAAKRDELVKLASKEIAQIEKEFGSSEMTLLDEKQISLSFPVEAYPEKVKSMNFDKTPEIEGVLQGIKGQYLIFDCGVLNIRKFGGYLVEFSA